MKKNGTATEVSNPESGASRVAPDLGPWPDANGRLLEGWARCNTAVLEGAIELAQDILTLTQARVRTDFRQGSWWSEWDAWLVRHSSDKVAPPSKGAPEKGLAPRRDAPGSYVRQP